MGGDEGDMAPNMNTYTQGPDGSVRERPEMSALRSNKVWKKLSHLFVVGEAGDIEDPLNSDPEPGVAQPSGGTKFGMWDGVFARCLLNIFGVIMFLRLGWLVGFAGWAMTMVTIILSVAVTTITTLSLSAICTNGEVAGGGAYYMISRSLGAEFGGSIGLMFFVANAVAVALYLVGFALTITSQMSEPLISATWDLRIVSLATLVFIQVLCCFGVSWVVKVQLGLLGVLLVSIGAFIIGCFTTHDDLPAFTGFTLGQGMSPDWDSSIGIAETAALNNLTAELTEELSTQVLGKISRAIGGKSMGFGLALAVFFPAVTGVMAGANISGDLKDASKAIPKGTLLAIYWSTGVYLFLAFLLGCVAIPLTVPDGWEACGSIKREGSCTDSAACAWEGLDGVCSPAFGGLWFDDILMAKIAIEPWLVYIGIYAATLSSAIASLVGAPRILQAVALDDLFSFLGMFKKGYGASAEPFPAYAITFAIATAMCMIGDINAIAPLITNFFMVTYAITNYACFAADMSNSPGWRPSFVYYNKWVSLIGAVSCIALMMFMEYITGFITLIISFAIYKYIEFIKPTTDWGSANEGYRYVSALKQMQRLEYTRKHVKNFRPAFLVLTGRPDESPGLAAIAANMRKGGGMCVFADVVTYDEVDHAYNKDAAMGRNRAHSVARTLHTVVEERLEAGKHYIASRAGMKAFMDVLPSSTFWAGAQSLLHCSGLGEMRPNTVILNFPEHWRETNTTAEGQEGSASQDDGSTIMPGAADSEQREEVSSASLLPALAENEASGFVATLGLAFDRNLGVAILRGESKLQLMPLALRVRSDRMKSRVKRGMRQSMRKMTTMNSFGSGASRGATGGGDDAVVDPEDEDDDLEDAAAEEAQERERVSTADGGMINDDLNGIELVDHSSDAATAAAAITSHAVALALSNSKRLTVADLQARQGGSQRIDVWWNADDGGLTVLLPYLLTQSPGWRHCKLRMMSVVRDAFKVGAQTAALVTMMKKFRIDSEVEVVANPEPQKPSPGRFEAAVELMKNKGGLPSESENTTRTHLKMGELIAEHSSDADLVVVTLPVPSIKTKPLLYMMWIDALSACDAPVMLVRGNQQDVLTFYS